MSPSCAVQISCCNPSPAHIFLVESVGYTVDRDRERGHNGDDMGHLDGGGRDAADSARQCGGSQADYVTAHRALADRSSLVLLSLRCQVNDISWLPQSQDVFVSVGFDGSLRAFDLRSLEHSTILYESPASRPLARIGFSPVAQHYLATFGLDDGAAIVLDMRSPGAPVAEVRGHGAGTSLSGIGWGMGSRAGQSGGGGWLATCGESGHEGGAPRVMWLM